MLIDMFSSPQKESDTRQPQCLRRNGPISRDGQHIAALCIPIAGGTRHEILEVRWRDPTPSSTNSRSVTVWIEQSFSR